MSEPVTTAAKVIELKCKLFDLIERQSLLAAENQRLEGIKTHLAKQLDEARKDAEATDAPNA